MGFLEILNQNSGFFNLIFSALVAFSTIVYAWLTGRLVTETRMMREAQTEPKVSATIQPREEWINFVDLVIQNIGLGPAYNVKFKVTPDFEYARGYLLSELGFIKNGLGYLAPNQKIQFFLTSLIGLSDEQINKPFAIKISYQNGVERTYENTYIIDLSSIIGLSQIEPPLQKIADSIKSIQTDINSISTGSHRIKVISYTKDEIEEENKQRLERIEGKIRSLK